MKEFNMDINKKLYYANVFVVIVIMLIGLFVSNPRSSEPGVGYIFHSLLVILLSVCFLLYPRHATHVVRMMIMTIAYVYFYMLFFLYPETWSTFIFLCFIPAISILFFDSKIFYFSLVLNSISIFCLFSYVLLIDQGSSYPYIQQDLTGNIINFIGSQVIIFYTFYLSYGRIQKQQIYYEQIQQSERLKTTGQLAAAVAHEIRNPLTVVKGFLQLYEQDASFHDNTKKHFHLMIDEVKTAEEVISQFLSIAKPDKTQEMQTIDIRVILQSVTDLLHSYGLLYDNKIELEVAESLYVNSNSIELKQLFVNIIKNAIEASQTGDSVIVSAGRKKGLVEIKVVDYGQGMSQEELESLGTPFYSLKSKGTGLGLMICYNIAAKYSGTLHFESSKGEGTTVTICFPLIKEPNQ